MIRHIRQSRNRTMLVATCPDFRIVSPERCRLRQGAVGLLRVEASNLPGDSSPPQARTPCNSWISCRKYPTTSLEFIMADGTSSVGRGTPGDPGLERRLKSALRGEGLFDAASRGRYSTDASIYQVEPVGVVVPWDRDDVAAVLAIAREAGVPVLPTGGGTSQCGQTVGRALILDCARYMNRLVSVDTASRRARVQPGLV